MNLRRSTWPLTYRRRACPWRKVTPPPLIAVAIGCEVHLTQPGSIANLTIRPQQIPSLALSSHEAIVKVQTAGLNFRDVLNVLGLDPTGTVVSIGSEMAAIISSVGAAHGHLLTSDGVYGLAPGSLRTFAWCDARLIRCVARNLETTGRFGPPSHCGIVDSRIRAQWYAGNAYL
jgi:hypothetical protein